jgi:hypothetical protein
MKLLYLLFFLIKKVTRPNGPFGTGGQKNQDKFPDPPFLLKEKVEPKVQADFDAVTVFG